MTTAKTLFITGANRGIGLGLTRAFLAKGHTVHAAARNPDGARDLWELESDFGPRCRIHQLDVAREGDLQKVASELKNTPIDILINNAGIYAEAQVSFDKVTADSLHKAFAVNSIAPLLVTQKLLPSLKASPEPVVATITSKMGSIADNTSGGAYAYRMSKAAVNMFNKSFAADHPGVTAVVLHPGWVKTDMGGKQAPTEITESAEGLMKVILKLTTKDSGKFFDFSGQSLPW